MPITRELVEFVRQKVAETPNILTAKLAAELGASEVEVITALPLHMRVKAKPDDFEAIWGVVRSWSETEVYGFNEQLLHNNANTRTVEMFDVKTIAKLQSPPPIKNEELGSIWFITKPQNGEEKNYVKFFDKNGHHLLTVCPLTEQNSPNACKYKADFDSLKKDFGVKPVPRNRCKGCGNCTCGGKGHEHHGHDHGHNHKHEHAHIQH